LWDESKVKLGVQITPLKEIVYDKPYDIVPTDWVGALFRKDAKPQKTDRFCVVLSRLYLYTMWFVRCKY